MANEIMTINDPLVIIFEDEGQVVCHIHPSGTASSHREYGLIICDLVRHVAHAFQVEEEEVWEWVDKERHHPTTEFTQPS